MKRIKSFNGFVNEEAMTSSQMKKMVGNMLLTALRSEEPVGDKTTGGGEPITIGGASTPSPTVSTVKVNPSSSFVGPIPFTYVNLNTTEGYKAYASIVQNFIDKRQPNPLKITGEMLAKSAKDAFNDNLSVDIKGTPSKIGVKGRYVPPELACAQMAQEGGIGNGNLSSRPIKTRNPFNVGNVDSGKNRTYGMDVQKAIDAYYFFVARDYLVPPKTAEDLLTNYVNKNNQRYASGTSYEKALTSISREANRYSAPVLAALNLSNKTPQDMA